MAASSSCSSAATTLTGPAPSITSATALRPDHFADILAEIADGDAAIDRHLALVGGSWPVIMRNSVVLPAPLGPTSPTFSPF